MNLHHGAEHSAAFCNNGLERFVVAIPVWQPEPALIALVQSLLGQGLGAIVVVDDGSDSGCETIYAQLGTNLRVHLLRHRVNSGKGRALKTAIDYCLRELQEMDGIVTADADGQHTVEAILSVAEALRASGGRAVLGSRGLDTDVPLRSRCGNAITRRVFASLTGARMRDTQSGLRGYPRAMLAELLLIEGERYEYEMAVLVKLCRSLRPLLEVPVRTVYLDGNKSSHFRPVRDSMRIYAVLACSLAERRLVQ